MNTLNSTSLLNRFLITSSIEEIMAQSPNPSMQLVSHPIGFNSSASANAISVRISSRVGRGRRTISSNHKASKKKNGYHHRQGMKKQRLIWTPELHQHFLEIHNRLPIGTKVFPKKILEQMRQKFPFITRENVASHLQKYRLLRKKLNNEENSAKSSSKSVPSKVPKESTSHSIHNSTSNSNSTNLNSQLIFQSHSNSTNPNSQLILQSHSNSTNSNSQLILQSHSNSTNSNSQLILQSHSNSTNSNSQLLLQSHPNSTNSNSQLLLQSHPNSTNPNSQLLLQSHPNSTNPNSQLLLPSHSNSTNPNSELILPSHSNSTNPYSELILQSHSNSTNPYSELILQSHSNSTNPYSELILQSHSNSANPYSELILQSHSNSPNPYSELIFQSHSNFTNPYSDLILQSHSNSTNPYSDVILQSHSNSTSNSTNPNSELLLPRHSNSTNPNSELLLPRHSNSTSPNPDLPQPEKLPHIKPETLLNHEVHSHFDENNNVSNKAMMQQQQPSFNMGQNNIYSNMINVCESQENYLNWALPIGQSSIAAATDLAFSINLCTPPISANQFSNIVGTNNGNINGNGIGFHPIMDYNYSSFGGLNNTNYNYFHAALPNFGFGDYNMNLNVDNVQVDDVLNKDMYRLGSSYQTNLDFGYPLNFNAINDFQMGFEQSLQSILYPSVNHMKNDSTLQQCFGGYHHHLLPQTFENQCVEQQSNFARMTEYFPSKV